MFYLILDHSFEGRHVSIEIWGKRLLIRRYSAWRHCIKLFSLYFLLEKVCRGDQLRVVGVWWFRHFCFFEKVFYLLLCILAEIGSRVRTSVCDEVGIHEGVVLCRMSKPWTLFLGHKCLLHPDGSVVFYKGIYARQQRNQKYLVVPIVKIQQQG